MPNDRRGGSEALRSFAAKVVRPLLVAIGRVIRIARIAALVAAALAFLVFVFSDNLVSSRMERTAELEWREEGLSRNAMRPTPIEGYTLQQAVPVAGDLHDAVLSPEATGVWIASADGRLLHYALADRDVTQTIRLQGMASPKGIAVATDGRLLVSDPSGVIAYVDSAGGTEVVYQAQPDEPSPLEPLRAGRHGDTLLILNGSYPPGIVSLTDGTAHTVYGYANLTDMLVHSGSVYVTGGHERGLPVAKLSSAGVDTFAAADPSWFWALPYWDRPFVSVDVDEHGFITIVDDAGHLVQLSPLAHVIQQTPPQGDDFGPARSIAALPDGALLIVHAGGVKQYVLNDKGAILRDAMAFTLIGDHVSALPLWEKLVEQEPHLLTLRRWLGKAYLATERLEQAAKQFYLAKDTEGFDAAVREAAYDLRKEQLWPIWMWLMGLTVALWVLNWIWPALVPPERPSN